MCGNFTETNWAASPTWLTFGGAHYACRSLPLDSDIFTQLVSVLEFLLPSSKYYLTLSLLPPPDPTAPTSTTTQEVQTAVNNTLPTLLEVVDILEMDERETVESEVRKARTRLDTASQSPEAVRRTVGTRVWGASKVWFLRVEALFIEESFPFVFRRLAASAL